MSGQALQLAPAPFLVSYGESGNWLLANPAMRRDANPNSERVVLFRPARLDHRASARIDAGRPGSFSVTSVAVSLPPTIRNTCRFWSLKLAT